MEKVDILKQTDIFYDLTRAQLEMVASICDERIVKLGDIIFEESTKSNEMVTIATLRTGQTFGEVVLVDQGQRTASARCSETEAQLLIIPRARFIKLCDTYPELGYRVMRNIAGDLAFKIRGSDLAIREQLLWRPRPSG